MKTMLRRFISTRPVRLSEVERKPRLAELQSWSMVQGRDAISKTFTFSDFNQKCHHPEWFNVYNRVEVTLSTHDCGGVSQNDIDMASAMDKYAASLKS